MAVCPTIIQNVIAVQVDTSKLWSRQRPVYQISMKFGENMQNHKILTKGQKNEILFPFICGSRCPGSPLALEIQRNIHEVEYHHRPALNSTENSTDRCLFLTVTHLYSRNEYAKWTVSGSAGVRNEKRTVAANTRSRVAPQRALFDSFETKK